jgi:PAS domain S-box-containing protein
MATSGERQPKTRDAEIEQVLDRAEAKFTSVFRACPDVITITAYASGRYMEVNDAFVRITGYDKAEVIGRTSAEIGIWETIEERHRVLNALVDSPRLENFEVRIRLKGGEIIDALLSAERVTLGGEDSLIIVARDISDRKRVEQALANSEARFRLATEASNDGLWDWDIPNDSAYFSPAYLRMLGYGPDELPMTGQTWLSLIHPDDRQRALAANQACIDNERESFAVEFRMKAKDGSWKWILGRGQAFWRGEDGRALRMIGTHVDITERKDAEIRNNAANIKLAEQARQLEHSNAALEQFAYVASHDLREPLRMISSYIALLARRYGASLDSDGREFLEFARDGAQRMDRMVLDLLEYSRVGRIGAPLAPVALTEVVGTAIGNLRLTIEDNAADIAVPDDLPTLNGSRDELVRLFQNLVGNALKYRHSERAPRIALGVEAGAGEWVFSVADNGIGIGAQYFDRIFDIFQRLHTRDQYDGTGIGLAICRKIVEHHGGRIWVESTLGEGATFLFTLRDRSAAI